MHVIGVDEHVWRHTPYGTKFVTVVWDLTPIRDRSGPSWLLDMVQGRSKQVFKTWRLPCPIRGVSALRSSLRSLRSYVLRAVGLGDSPSACE